MTLLTVEDMIWNRAALESGGPSPREGDIALAAVLAAHGLVMNGGVHHAVEVLSRTELTAALKGFRFLSLSGAADLLEIATTLDEDVANRRYWDAIPDDGALQARYRAVYRSSPAAFSPIVVAG
jgi:hypothetical protein